jgi:hypothetical protein
MTDEEPPHHKWARLLDEEQQAFDLAERKAGTAGPSQRANLARDWFAASSRLLMHYWATHAVPGQHDPVRDATKVAGRPERWPGERRDLAVALHYIAFVKRGVILDKHHNVTVAEAFHVDRTTVQKWWRHRDSIWSGMNEPPADHFPDVLLEAGARYHFNQPGESPEGADET